MLRNTKPSDAESHTECDKADGFGPIRYRIPDTRTENFWDANFTSVASVGKNFVPASPAGPSRASARAPTTFASTPSSRRGRGAQLPGVRRADAEGRRDDVSRV